MSSAFLDGFVFCRYILNVEITALQGDIEAAASIWQGGPAELGEFSPVMPKEWQPKAVDLRQLATALLLGKSDSVPERYRKPVTVGQIEHMARLLLGRGEKPKRLPIYPACVISGVPIRLGLALRPQRSWVVYYDGWAPREWFKDLCEAIEVEAQGDYEDAMETMEHEALGVIGATVRGDNESTLRYKAAKDVIERRRGKPAERIDKRALNIDLSVKLSAEDLRNQRRLLQRSSLGGDGEDES